MYLVFKWAWVLICLFATVSRSSGQSTAAWPVAAGVASAPRSGILDQNGFFQRDQEALARISKKLLKLEADHGYRIYLKVEASMIGTSVNELSHILWQAWLPDGDGMVVVFEGDSKSLSIGRNPDGPDSFENAAAVMPTQEAAAVIRRAMNAVDPALPPVPYIERLIDDLVNACNDYFERRKTPPPAGRSLRVWLFAIGALTLLCLLGIAVGALVRHADRKAQLAVFRFPAADRPERFGAPSGARVTARRFDGQPPRSP